MRLIGSPGQRNDIAFAHELIEGFAPDVTIGDKGYDADHLCDKIAESGRPACHSAQAEPHVQASL